MAVLVYSSAHDRSVLPCRLSPISVPPLRFPSPAPSCLKSPTWAYHQQHHPFTICTTTGDTAGPGVVDQPACDGHLPQPNAHRSSAAAVLALTTHALGRRRRRWSCCISSMLRRNADHTYTYNAPRNKTIPKWKLNNGHLMCLVVSWSYFNDSDSRLVAELTLSEGAFVFFTERCKKKQCRYECTGYRGGYMMQTEANFTNPKSL